MSDDVNTNSASTVAPDGETSEKTGFLSTATGRIIAIVGALAVLGVIAGVAVAILLQGLAGDDADDLLVQPGTPGVVAPTAPVTTGAVAAAAPAAEVAYSEVFTFRNIFIPLLKPKPEPVTPTTPTTTTATPGTPDTETPYARGVLYLDRVVTEEGVSKAVLRYNDTTYTLGPGETIPGTPWEVVSVSSTSVTMLYGDVRVTLAVGQGISK